MTSPAVSIVIPTLNGGDTLGRLLDGITDQTDAPPYEVIAVDSGSTDGTRERLRRAGAAIVDVDPLSFNHGVTRNRGLEQASGDIAVLMVQDAVPASSRWLAALVGPLLADEGVAGAFARQCAWPGASRLTAHYLSKWTAAQSDPRTAGPITRSMFDAMSPSQRHATCAFDNVCSCIRMTVWRRFPFRATPIAEDLEWAREVLLAGYRLAYVPEATVWHSHERSTRYELQRTYLVHQRLQTLFGLSTVPTVGALCRAVASSFPMHLRLAAGDRRPRRHALVRGAALAVALPLGQYLGARSAREGRELLRTQGI